MSMHRFLLVVLACATAWGCSRQSVTPAASGSVTIYRDVYGAPHVYAEREEDGYWGLGYSTAEDHLEGMLLRYLALKGELAAAFGAGPVAEETGLRATALPGRAIPDAVASDLENLRWRHLADARQNFSKLPEQVQLNLQSYISGIQRFMEEHPERVPRWAPTLEPALPLAISSLFMLFSSTGTCQAAISQASPVSGSNVWALPATRMREGAAVFSSDSHGVIEDGNGTFLTPTRVHAGNLDVWLLDVPGAIMGLKGHSRHYGWGWAEGPRRPADCIVLETVPGKPRTYLYDGKAVEMTVVPYVIEVAGGDSITGELEYTSHNGVMSPVVHRSGTKAWAVSSSYMGRAGFAHVQFRDMLLATNEAEMDKALSATGDLSGQPRLFELRRIDQLHPPRSHPDPPRGVRRREAGGRQHVRRRVARPARARELLRLKNPAQGYLSNSNVSPDMMFGEPVLKAETYPPDFAFQPGQTGTRQLRSIEMLQGNRVFSFEDAIDVVADVKVVNTDKWGPVIREVMAANPPADSAFRQYVDSLGAFDGRFVPASRGALYHALMRIRLRAGDRAVAAAIESAINTGKALSRRRRGRLSSCWSIRAMRRSRGTHGASRGASATCSGSVAAE